MDINIEPKNFDASSDLKDQLNTIFQDLDKYNDQIVSADIYLEDTNKSEDKDKEVKVKIFLPGHDIFVDEVDESFLSAAQIAYDRVKRLLIDRKEKDKENRQPRPDKP